MWMRRILWYSSDVAYGLYEEIGIVMMDWTLGSHLALEGAALDRRSVTSRPQRKEVHGRISFFFFLNLAVNEQLF